METNLMSCQCLTEGASDRLLSFAPNMQICSVLVTTVNDMMCTIYVQVLILESQMNTFSIIFLLHALQAIQNPEAEWK